MSKATNSTKKNEDKKESQPTDVYSTTTSVYIHTLCNSFTMKKRFLFLSSYWLLTSAWIQTGEKTTLSPASKCLGQIDVKFNHHKKNKRVNLNSIFCGVYKRLCTQEMQWNYGVFFSPSNGDGCNIVFLDWKKKKQSKRICWRIRMKNWNKKINISSDV